MKWTAVAGTTGAGVGGGDQMPRATTQEVRLDAGKSSAFQRLGGSTLSFAREARLSLPKTPDRAILPRTRNRGNVDLWAKQALVFVNGEFLYRDIGHLRRNLNPSTLDKMTDLRHLGTLFDFSNISAERRASRADPP